MLKILIVSILLALVYSWDEFKYTCKLILRAVIYAKPPAQTGRGLDRFVGSVIMLGSFPIALGHYLTSTGPEAQKLALAAGELLVLALAATASVAGIRYLNGALVLQSLFSPALGVLGGFDVLERKTFAKLAWYLSLPALAGLALKLSVVNFAHEKFVPLLDSLIQVLIGALVINFAVLFLEKHSSLRRLKKLSHYFRVLLGIVLTAVLVLYSR